MGMTLCKKAIQRNVKMLPVPLGAVSEVLGLAVSMGHDAHIHHRLNFFVRIIYNIYTTYTSFNPKVSLETLWALHPSKMKASFPFMHSYKLSSFMVGPISSLHTYIYVKGLSFVDKDYL